jgi:penicillin-binding protein 1A
MARRRSRSEDEPGKRGWLRRIFNYGLILGALTLLAAAVMIGVAWSELPEYDALKSSPNGQMIRVHALDGSVIVSLGPSYGDWINFADIPSVMIDAMTSIEDKRFRSHPGVDPIGIARSFYQRAVKGHFTQGGSTITQQLARNVFLTNNKNFSRKSREAILALAMERKYSKDQILEAYLNKAYFGGGAYGIDAASRRFFGHPATKLSLEEAAIIAGLVKAPSNYAPTADATAAIGRAGVVLQAMHENGKISADQMRTTQLSEVKLAPEPMQNSVRYFTDWALPQLDTMIDNKTDPLDVWTTIDPSMQRAADAAIRASVPKGAQGALVALDRDGAVRAMIGGTDYVTTNYNRATKAIRQPGSSFKLFVYLAALEAGKKATDMMVDEPVTIEGWSPKNSNGKYSGAINLRTAFAYSVNTIAAKLGQEIGTSIIANMARRFGITTPVNVLPSMVLGSSDVRLIEMTKAFAAISARGVAVTPYGIIKVTTAKKALLFQYHVDTSRVLVTPDVAAGMTDLMQTAVNTGTGKSAQIGRPVAGKTGTTSSNKDGWFLGFSSGLTTGVWMGRDDSKPVRDLFGGHAPAQAFARFMKVAVANRPIEKFATAVTLPEWQLEPDADAYYSAPNSHDDTGNDPPAPADLGTTTDAAPATQKLDQQWIDEAIGKGKKQ